MTTRTYAAAADLRVTMRPASYRAADGSVHQVAVLHSRWAPDAGLVISGRSPQHIADRLRDLADEIGEHR